MQATLLNQNASTIFAQSQLQQAAWFIYKLYPNSNADKLAFGIRITSKVDINKLQNSFQKIINIYPTLRSAYYQEETEFIQLVYISKTVQLEILNASLWNEEELQENLKQTIQKPFHLETADVIRMSLFSFSEDDHILLFVVHCIACDKRSLSTLANDLLELYSGKNIEIKSTDLYQDYINREEDLLNGNRCEEIENFWKKHLAGNLPLLTLPTSQGRSPLRSYNGGSRIFRIKPEITERLKTLAVAENLSLPFVLLTAWNILIYRYTGEEDIIIGWLIAQRQVVGNFTNLLPLRISITDNLSARELSCKIKEVFDGVIQHQDYPFPALVRKLQSDVSNAYPPICQVAFSYEDNSSLQNNIYSLLRQNLGEVEFEYYQLPQGKSEFDLGLEIFELDDSLVCNFNYDSDLIDAQTITRMEEHFENLLSGIINNFQYPIFKFDLLSREELQELLFSWNNTEVNYDLSLCLHQLFEAQVERTPDLVAIKFGEEELTYRQLNTNANQLAYYLQSLGVEPDTLVGVCVERSLSMVIALLGIIKAGGAYVPIDPGYPQERINYILEDSFVSVLLTQSQLRDNLAKSPAEHIICLDIDWEKISLTSQGKDTNKNPNSQVAPENLAYVIYTSGSTGKPKGAMNTHQGVCNRLLWMQDTYRLNQGDSTLQKTPFSFDVSVWEFFWTLINGARLVIAEPGGHRDSTYLVNTIIKENITTLHFVPSMLQVFLLTKGVEDCQSIKRVICSGEALAVDLQERFFSKLECELHNLYGPTEAAIDVTYWHCQPNSSLKTVPIGRPVANTQLYILDKYLQPVPMGVAGELYIGGVQVARGYFNRPPLTAERFIRNPFAIGQMYKTGDLVRYLPDGNIEYIGRIDYQVKIRGFRIELGEIENTLTSHDDIREAVVIAQTDHLNNKHLIAYIVTNDQQPTSQQLKAYFKQVLPEYMVPSTFVILDSLPLNNNGKVERQSLPQVEISAINSNKNYTAPRNDLERQLVQVWSEILRITKIGVRDNFFEIGGNSLCAIYLMTAIEQRFGRELPLAMLFANGTIEELAEILQKDAVIDTSSPIVAIQSQGTKRPFFCVHPAGGHVLCYFTLARYLGTDQPFYGLQAQGFYGDEEPLTTVEEMASLYVKAIKSVQSEGPYQVGGWSFGGVVAYEIAQQLYRQGDEVSLLAILDSYVPILLDKAKNIDNLYLVGVLSRVFGGMFGQDNLVTPEELESLTTQERLDYIIEKARIAKIFPPGVEKQNNRRILDVLVGTLKATYSYQRQPYPGKVTIFRATEKHIMAPDPTMVWVELFSVLAAGEIEIFQVPGHHYSFVLEPHVPALAESLKACL
jgi:amino acid adenylation domain-containing protein